MPVARVLSPGLLTTVQDLGRFGYRHLGIPVSGGIDQWALRLANMLVGNNPGEAVLEMNFNGPSILFLRDCVVAITGADMEPSLSGKRAPMWESFFCSEGEVLSFGYRKEGCRSYLAFYGGIDVPVVLGSRSTLLSAGFGGLEGRQLKKGDFIKTVHESLENAQVGRLLPPEKRPYYLPEISVKVVRGINSDLFSEQEYTKFYSSEFIVTPRSDRMGYCLAAQRPITSAAPATAESFPAAPGSIQILPSGQPIVLLNDSQSTGGYPQIACVISGEIWKIGQASPGDRVVFQETDMSSARQIAIKNTEILECIQKAPALNFYMRTPKYCYEVKLQNYPEKGNNIRHTRRE